MLFRYRVLDERSLSREGFLEAGELEDARKGLEGRGWYIVSLGEADESLQKIYQQQLAEEAKAAKREAARAKAGPKRRWQPWRHPLFRKLPRLLAGVAVAWALVGAMVLQTPAKGPGKKEPPRAQDFQVHLEGRVKLPKNAVRSQVRVAFVLPDVPYQEEKLLGELTSSADNAFTWEVALTGLNLPRRVTVRLTCPGCKTTTYENLTLSGTPLTARLPALALEEQGGLPAVPSTSNGLQQKRAAELAEQRRQAQEKAEREAAERAQVEKLTEESRRKAGGKNERVPMPGPPPGVQPH